MAREDKIDIARLLALYASRYPDLFGHPNNIARFYAIILQDARSFSNYVAFNAHLRWSGFPPTTHLNLGEYRALCAVSDGDLDLAIDKVLRARGYQLLFENQLLLLGEFPTAARLLEFDWELIQAPADQFIFSDRPIPPRLVSSVISLGITARFGIRLNQRDVANVSHTIRARPAENGEVTAINAEVRRRAQNWVCGPEPDRL